MFNISLLQRTFNSRTYSCRRKTTINLASTDTKNSYACSVTTTTTKSQYSRTIIHTNAKWCNNVKEGPVSAARWRLRADGGLDWPGGASSSGWRNPAGLKRCWIQILQSSLRKATNSRQKNQSARTLLRFRGTVWDSVFFAAGGRGANVRVREFASIYFLQPLDLCRVVAGVCLKRSMVETPHAYTAQRVRRKQPHTNSLAANCDGVPCKSSV